MPSEPSASNDQRISALVDLVLAEGGRLYRDFPWRSTHDPYAVLVSEVMLQQTQVTRVVRYYERWLESFPTLEILSDAPLEAVLRAWQGLGYNRRAIALKRLAEQVAEAAKTAGSPPDCLPTKPRSAHCPASVRRPLPACWRSHSASRCRTWRRTSGPWSSTSCSPIARVFPTSSCARS